MARRRPHHHRLDIYNTDLWLATTPQQWGALCRTVGIVEGPPPDSAGQANFATFHPNDGGMIVPVCAIWINQAQHKTIAELVDTCAHEASHIAGYLLAHIGQDHHGSNEAHAYLVGWLTRWIWERCQ